MEPISLILAALAAGATSGAKDTAGKVIKDSYEGLKGLIKSKFAENEAAKVVLDEHEKDPETYEAPLKKKLSEAGVDKEDAILKAAQEILKQAKSEESMAAKFKTEFQAEVKGAQIGDGNTQENTFS
jgi:hypothetical protein